MEFDDVSEDLEREARQVAAAFGVGKLRGRVTEEGKLFEEQIPDGVFEFVLAPDWIRIVQYDVTHDDEEPLEVRNIFSRFVRDDGPQDRWIMAEDISFWDFVARGFYQLGFEGQDFLRQLPKLSAHEKLELRLSMPREFWPKTWLDEEQIAQIEAL